MEPWAANTGDTNMPSITIKYWLDPDGKEIKGSWHMDIAAVILQKRAVKLKPEYDNDDVFPPMFKLGFIRVTEEDMTIHMDNDGRRPNSIQRDWANEKKGEGFHVVLNSKAYMNTRGGRSSARNIAKAAQAPSDGVAAKQEENS